MSKLDLFIINLLIILIIFDFTILAGIIAAAYLITKIEIYFIEKRGLKNGKSK